MECFRLLRNKKKDTLVPTILCIIECLLDSFNQSTQQMRNLKKYKRKESRINTFKIYENNYLYQSG